MPHILVRDQEDVEVLKISKIATMDILYGFESPVWTWLWFQATIFYRESGE